MKMDPILAGEVRLMRPESRLVPMDYEDTYQFVKDIPPEYKCVICSKLMREPQVTECCGQHFCRNCLEMWLAKNFQKQCPHCRVAKCNYIRYLPMKREINELEIYCLNKANGCTTTVALDKIDEHLSQCDFEQVQCVCGLNYLQKDLKNHKQHSCPNRLVNCQYCNAMGEHRFITSTAHRNECPDFPINCPRNCTLFPIKRKDMNQHKQQCPFEPVQCQYFNVGCQQQVQRKDYNTHIRNNVEKHLELTMAAFTQLSTHYNTLHTNHENLKAAHEKLNKEHDALKQKKTVQWSTPSWSIETPQPPLASTSSHSLQNGIDFSPRESSGIEQNDSYGYEQNQDSDWYHSDQTCWPADNF